jgi:PAS domain-containing protein
MGHTQTDDEGNRDYRRLLTVLGSVTDGLAVLDNDWRFIYCDEHDAATLGMRTEQLLGSCVWDLFADQKRCAELC